MWSNERWLCRRKIGARRRLSAWPPSTGPFLPITNSIGTRRTSGEGVFDTDILLYTATSDAKKQQAAACLGRGGCASVQVLNEFVHVARRKLRHDWPQIEFALGQFYDLLDDVVPVTLNTHTSAVSLAREHGLSFYDALIVAAAVEA